MPKEPADNIIVLFCVWALTASMSRSRHSNPICAWRGGRALHTQRYNQKVAEDIAAREAAQAAAVEAFVAARPRLRLSQARMDAFMERLQSDDQRRASNRCPPRHIILPAADCIAAHVPLMPRLSKATSAVYKRGLFRKHLSCVSLECRDCMWESHRNAEPARVCTTCKSCS